MTQDLVAPSKHIDQALLDAQAVHLRTEQDYTFEQIAAEMGCSVSTAHRRVMRAYARIAGPNAQESKNRLLKSLDDAEVAVLRVLETSHLTVTEKGVVCVEINGQKVPVPDDSPVLQAVDRLLKINHQRAQLTGAYAPIKVTQEVKHSVQSDLDREIEGLLEGLGRVGESSPPVAVEGAAHTADT